MGGITPQEAEEIAFRTSGETHWYPPSEEEKERADSQVILALISAERIRQNVAQDSIQNIPAEERKVAEHFIKNYAYALPTIVNDNVVGWPPKAKEFLKRYFDESRLENALDQG